MGSKKEKDQRPSFIGTGIVLVVLVVGLISIASWIKNTITTSRQPTIFIDPYTDSDLNVTADVVNTTCEDDAKIEYSLVNIVLNGGTPPYQLTIVNSHAKLWGPYDIKNNNEPVQIKIYGGDSFNAKIQSSDNKLWEGNIRLPLEDNFCKTAPTETATPIIISSPTLSTPPTSTPIVVIAPTSTEFAGGELGNTPIVILNLTSTETVLLIESLTTNSGNLTQSSPTSGIPPSATAQSTATFQSGSPSVIPPIQPTVTSPPLPTPTVAPPPPPTNTPINPNPRECEDGIDNDGDGYIDSADPECKKPSDPHEDK